LPDERVVDLEEDLDFRLEGDDFVPDFVNVKGDRGLGNPSESLGEKAFDSVKVDATVAEAINHHAGSGKLALCTAMPFLDAGVRGEPAGLEKFRLVDSAGSGDCHRTGRAAVVSPVDEGFGKLSLTLKLGFVFRVVWVGFDEFGGIRCGKVLEGDAVEDMEINAHAESGLEVVIVGFPHDYLKIGTIVVSVADSVAGIGDEEAPDIGEGVVG
jgi:hypothetical protein